MKIPQIETAKKTLKSLEECDFQVKEYENGDSAVMLKSIIVVGPLSEKKYAESLARELNSFVEKRKVAIETALQEAEQVVRSAISGAINNVDAAIVGKEDAEDTYAEGIPNFDRPTLPEIAISAEERKKWKTEGLKPV